MRARPTTTVDILGGTTTDSLGDVVDASTVIVAGVLASILEQDQRSTRKVDDRRQVARRFTARLPNGTPVTMDHRLRDAAGQVYLITDITAVANPVSTNDLKLSLRIAND